MTRRRLLVAHAVILALVGGSLYDIVTDQEHWPFSQYPMFSYVWRDGHFTLLRLYGVAEDGREIPLDHRQYIEPFDQSRLPKALRQIGRRPSGAGDLRQAVADCFLQYEHLRRAGEHDGPRLLAMRLYDVRWTLDPEARNVEAPDSRQLLAEYVDAARPRGNHDENARAAR